MACSRLVVVFSCAIAVPCHGSATWYTGGRIADFLTLSASFWVITGMDYYLLQLRWTLSTIHAPRTLILPLISINSVINVYVLYRILDSWRGLNNDAESEW